ncbi:MAG: PKD domain-containing protein, partial [Thermoplasmata archaeon]|nr:PKD domain-containing protein [Thermoplasmata archaeon]
VWNYSSNSTIRLTEQAGCGFPWNSEIAPTGNCTFSAHFSLLGSGAQPDGGHLGSLVLYFNLTANGTPSTWYPTVTYSYGPLTGSAPLNLSLNLSAAHGVAPYYYDYLVLGRSSGAPNATAFGPYYRVGYGWNGSAVSFVIPLNATGYYWGTVFIADTANNWVSDALPLINLGNVTIPAPLRVDATETNATVPSPGRGAGVAFEASTLGGRGPFEVQWQFGDGAFASSLPGQSIQHVYTVSGTYQPTVTITDALGHAVVTTLPTVTVTVTAPPTHSTPPKGTEPPPSPTVGSAPSPSIAWTQVAGAAGVAIALVVLGALLVRREVGRAGEELVAGLTPTGPPPGPSEPPK